MPKLDTYLFLIIHKMNCLLVVSVRICFVPGNKKKKKQNLNCFKQLAKCIVSLNADSMKCQCWLDSTALKNKIVWFCSPFSMCHVHP